MTATDDDNDTRRTPSSWTDAASFVVSGASRILTTSRDLRLRTKSSYAVVVKANDGNDGTATVAVAIDLLDVDEPAERTDDTRRRPR